MPLSSNLPRKSKPRRTRPVIESMEPRILYSADGLSALLDLPQQDHDTAVPDAPPLMVHDTQQQHDVPQAAAAAPAHVITTELVVVDARVADYQRLVEAIQARSSTDAWFEIIVLNQIDSGISQITELLAQRQDVSAVHILSHGQDGGVQLGAGWVDGQMLQQQAQSLVLWQAALTENADVLLYGCEVAEGSAGHAFIQELARLTGADVAASSNLTGNAEYGGDWVFEEHTGIIDTNTLLPGVERELWSGTLAPPVAVNDNYSVSEDSTLVVAPSTTNLSHWWKFDEAAGQTAVDSGSLVNNGTLGSTAGADTNDPAWTTGHVGAAGLSFDGAGDYVETTSTELKTATNFTLSAWFQTDTTTGAHHILWQGYAGGNGFGSGGSTSPATSEMSLSVGGYNASFDNKIVFSLGYDVPPTTPNSIFIVSASNFTDIAGWHHVAVTLADVGGGVMSASLYVDGKLEGTDTGTENDRTAWGALRIGAPGDGTRSFDGHIDEVRVYQTALSDAGIQAVAQPGVLQNDTDADFNILSAVLVSGPAQGAVTLQADGSFVYTPVADFNGTDAFTYMANDGTADSNVATVNITVNAVADIVPDALTTNEDTPVTANLITGTNGASADNFESPGRTLTGVTQGSNGSVTFLADGTVTYTPNLNFFGSDNFTYTVTSGGATETVAVNVTVSAVNDAPTATNLNAAETYTEDTALNLTNIVAGDVDSANLTATLTLSNIPAGSLSAATSGAVTSTYNAGTGVWTASGALADVNTLLAGVTFNPASNFNSNFSIATSISDGVAAAITGSKTITGTPVNDAPTVTITPPSYAASEQVALTLHGTGLSIADVDAGAAAVRATVSVSSGVLTAAAGTTGVSISGNGTNSVTLDGTLTQINNLLAGGLGATLTYTANSDTPAASDTLTLTASDLGNTGTGGTLTGNDTATINITAVNDAPTATIVPASYAATEQVALTLHGTGLSIADVDAGGAAVRATVSVVSGIINAAAGTTGVIISGSGTNTVTLDGNLIQINNLLAGNLSGTLTYTANSDIPAASTTLTLTASDLGNTGTGGTLTGNDTATINITTVNDAPTATITPLTYAATEQVALTLHGTGLSIADVDAGAAVVRATVSVTSGILNAAAGTTGVTIGGSGTNTVTLDGTLTQINNLLAGGLGATLTYTANSDTPAASDTLTLTASDLGNTGTGGTLTGNDTATINIAAVNDAPTATIVPASYAATEQVALSLHATGLSIADVDAGAAAVRATVSVVSGIINAAAGTTGVSISGNGTNTVTLDGTLTQINNLLAGNLSGTLTYSANSDTPAASDTLTLTASDLGNTGMGGTLTGNDTAAINITAVNDAPTATITPLTYAATEQVALTLHGTGLSIADVDVGGAAVRATVSVVSGIINAAAGTTGVTLSGSGTNTVTLDGTLAQINNLLAGNLSGTLTYTANSDTPAASDTLTLSASDLGNTGTGGTLTGNDTATISITAVNDAPTATITPASYAVTEQVALTLHGTGLAIADVDAGAAAVRATVSVVGGILNAAAGTTGVTVTGSGTNTVTLDGTLTQINNLLAGNLSGTLTYTATSDTPAASDTLTLTASDLGNTGSGGILTGNDTATINITAVNDAPTATITPASYAATEQVALTLHGTGLSIADVDAGAVAVRATVSVTSGILNAAAGTTGVTISGTGTNTVTLDGTLTQINNLLAGNLSGTLTYTATSDTPAASDTLTLTASDLGNTGTGGTLTGNDTATINITAVNDAPTATITPLTYAATEQVALTLHGTGLSITDVDAGAAAVRATISVVSGILNAAAGTTGVTVTGSGTNTVTLDGTLTQINNLLAGNLSSTLTYTTTSDTPAASDTLTLTASDLGNTGSGGALTGNDTATINITAVNDAPTATITPLTYAATEQVALALHGTGLNIADVDAGAAAVRATVSVASGILTAAAGTTGVTVSGSGTATVTLDGNILQINNLLAGNLSGTLTYTANSDTPAASDTLTLTASDLGNTGTGGTLTGNDTATINITAVNDAPTATIIPLTYAAIEQVALTLQGTGLSIADVDAGAAAVRATISVVSGILNAAAGTTGVTISGSGTNTVTLDGTLTQINNLLAGNLSGTLTYTATSNTPVASDTLTLTASDLGNTGTGGTLTGNDTASINITAVNDAPTATITPLTFAATEQVALTLHGTGLSIADVDAGAAAVRATVSVTSGILTAAAGTTSVTVTGSGTATVTLDGTLIQINNLLAGNLSGTLTYTAASDTPLASDTLTLTASDLGNTGTGGTLTGNDTATINITAVNDAPTATITPLTYAATEQVALTLHGTGLSIADVDAGAAAVRATVSVTSGIINAAAGTTGVTISGTGTNTVTLDGTLTQINNLLAGNLSGTLTYTATSDTPTASDTFTLTASDLGNTGSGGILTGNDTAIINITAVNDAPTATITPLTYAATEQVALTLHGTGLSIADVDAGAAAVRATVSVVSGILNAAAGTTGVTVSGSGTNTVTMDGTLAQINNLLAGNLGSALTYTATSDTPSASDTLTLTASDLGNTGTGGTLTGNDTATINITAVNDAPTATIVPVSYAATEQVALTLHGTGLAIVDVDAGAAAVRATVSVTSGIISATAGTTGVTIIGSGTTTVTLDGTLIQINNLLAGNLSGTLTYTANSDTPAASATLTLSASDLGNTGSGGTLTGNDTAIINITAVNDAPTATITPLAYAATEQVALTLHGTGLSIADVDAGAAAVRATVSVVSGVLNAAAGTTGVSISGSGTNTVTLDGTLTQINDQLAGNLGGTLTYTATSDTPSASDTLTLSASDLGNTGTGGTLTGNDTATINISAVNDAPTATIIPVSYAATEQVALTLHGTGLSIADVDAGAAAVRAAVSVTSGIINATSGTTGVTITGNGTNTVTLDGTLAQINDLLAGNLGGTLTYTANSDTPAASDTLTLTASDLGNTGGGILTGNDTATINITAVNDAPTATITPLTYAATEQVALTLHGTGLSIADVDAGAAAVRATVSVVSGILNAAAGTTGVTVSGSGTNTVTMDGTLAQINNLLAGNLSGTLTYTATSDTPTASDTFTLSASDLGNTGSGGTLTGNDTATINISAVNDAPTATIVPVSYAATEQVALTLHGTGLAIADVDGAAAPVRATVSVTSGILTAAAGTTGVTVTGSGTTTVTLDGTLAQINDLLAGNLSSTLTYTATSDTPAASDTLTLTASDLGNTGSGGILTGNDTVTINISAVNDAPTATITPLTYAATEQVALTLHGSGLSIADVDAGAAAVRATVSVTSGILNAAAGTTGVTISGSGNATVTIDGTLIQINNLLAGNLSGTLTYIANSDTPATSDILTLTASDLGNTGTGGTLIGNDTATINITAVNDAPTATITPASYAATEQVALALHGTGLAIADVDAGAATVRATVSVTSGILNVAAGTTGVTVTGSGTNTVTLDGTLTQINDLLAGNLGATLTYTATSDTPPASDTLTLTASDLGNTGTGGTLTGIDTATINITAVNDAPTATNLSAAETYTEDTALNLTDIVASDVDSANITATLTLSNTAAGSLSTGTLGAVTSTYNALTGVWTASGALADVNALLAGVTFNPAGDFNSNFTIATSVSDGVAAAITGIKNITGTPVNDAPTTTPIILTAIAEDSGGRLITQADILANATDIDGPALTATNLTISSGSGTLIDNGNGTWTYTPALNDDTAVNFTYTVTDGSLTAAGTASLDITPVNDAPTNTPVTLTAIAEDSGPRIITQAELLANANDVDGPALTAKGLTISSGAGTLIDNGNGTWTYTPALNDNSAVTFNYTVSDGALTAPGTASLDITPINDAPVNVVPGTQTVNEDAALAIAGVSVGDIDGNLADTQLTVVNGTLTVDLSGGATISAGANGTSTLTLSGSEAQINAALATLSYQGSLNFNGDDTLTVFSRDSAGVPLADSDSVAIKVIAQNDGPFFNMPVSQNTAEDTPLLFSPGTGNAIVLGDVDAGSGLMILTIGVANGTVTLGSTSGLTFLFGDGTADTSVGVRGTLADLNAAVNGLIFAPTANFTGNANLSFALDDNGNSGSPPTVKVIIQGMRVVVSAVNDAPVNTVPAAQSTNEDTALVFSSGSGNAIAISDIDAGAAPVEVRLSSANGTLTLAGAAGLTFVAGDGTADATMTIRGTIANINSALNGLVFAPNADFNGAASIQIVTNDLGNAGTGGAKTDTDTIAVDVMPVNDRPVTTPVTLTAINEDSGARLITQAELLANATDVDSLALTATGLTISSGAGTLVDNGNGTWTYAPALNDDTAVTFSYTVTDGSLTAAGTASLDITPVNDPPATTPVTLTAINEDSGARLITQAELLANATDVDGPTLTATGLTISSGAGTLIDNGNGTWTYTPALNDDTAVSFSYTVTDGSLSAAGTASLDITPVNDPPVTTPVTLTAINEDSAARLITQAELLANATDVDSPALSAINLVISSGAGTLIDNGNGTWTYTPALNDDTAVSFSYTVTDGSLTATGLAILDITPMNDPPVTTPVTLAAIIEDSGAGLITQAELLANASDVDGPALTATGLTISSGAGTLIDNGNGTWTYTPALNDDTAVTFSYTVTDGSLTAAGTASLDITPVNDAPVTSPTTLIAINEDSGARLITQAELLANANASDVDGPALTATGLTISSGAGTVIDNGNGTWTYTPALNDDTAVTFSYTVTDGSLTAAGSASLDITPVNDPPVTTPVTLTAINEDSGARLIMQAELLANATDVDGPALTATSLTISSGAGTLIDNGNGTWTYTPALNDDTAVSFSYTVTDGSLTAIGTASLDITLVNDPPATTPVILTAIAEDSGARLITQAELLANASDVDGPALTATSLTISSGAGTLIDNGNGTWTYTPALNDDTAVSFSYTVTDGSLTATGTASLDITPVNDAPVTTPVTLTAITEGSGPLVITRSELLTNASDVEGQPLSISNLAISSGSGVLADNGNGTWTFTAAPNGATAVGFTFVVSDGSLNTLSSATLAITPKETVATPRNDGGPRFGETVSTSGISSTGSSESVVQTFDSPAEQPNTETGGRLARIAFDRLADAGDLFGTLGADEPGRRGLTVSAQTALLLQGSTGFISKLALVARQADFSLTLAGYDFGEYTFQFGRLSLLQQTSGRGGEHSAAGISLSEPGTEDGRERAAFEASTLLRVSGMSLTLGIAAWALRSGGLLAAMLSSLPAWRQVDLLPILGDPDKRKAEWEQAGSEAEREERAVDRMLGGRVGSRRV